ncbi:MAG: radical SAM protein [Thermodesulfovibrionales bacterium]|nr:radical SAM protein [Thermodesulfovibrionales bacterium]
MDITRDIDLIARLLEIKKARATGPEALEMLVGVLAEPHPALAGAAIASISALSPMAVFPERLHDDTQAEGLGEEGLPGWLVGGCRGWGGLADLPSLIAGKAAPMLAPEAEVFLERAAVFQGAQRLIYKRLRGAGLDSHAALFRQKVLELRRKQFPAQVSLSATMACQLRCDFCIAEDSVAAAESLRSRPVTYDDAMALLDWMDAHGVKRLSLTGGEPTLYERVSDIIDEARKRGMEFYFSTNGLFGSAMLKKIIERRPLCVTMHLAPEITGARLEEFVSNARSLVEAGIYAVIRCNIVTPEDDYTRFLEAATASGIKEIRAAVAMPNSMRANAYVSAEHLKSYSRILASFAREADERCVLLVLTKPYPPCMLDEETAGRFLSNGSYETNCSIQKNGFSNNLVVYPDLSFSPCLGLNGRVSRRIVEYEGPRDASLAFIAPVRELMGEHLLEQCGSCPLSIGARCIGACLSYRADPPEFYGQHSHALRTHGPRTHGGS